jgi:hypothetical protein
MQNLWLVMKHIHRNEYQIVPVVFIERVNGTLRYWYITDELRFPELADNIVWKNITVFPLFNLITAINAIFENESDYRIYVNGSKMFTDYDEAKLYIKHFTTA